MQPSTFNLRLCYFQPTAVTTITELNHSFKKLCDIRFLDVPNVRFLSNSGDIYFDKSVATRYVENTKTHNFYLDKKNVIIEVTKVKYLLHFATDMCAEAYFKILVDRN